MDMKQKMAAAALAVIAYIQEEGAAAQPQPESAQAAAALPPAAVSPWGASGRQSQMQLRNLMQLRAFNRI